MDMCFLFFILDDKISKFTYVKFEKTDIKLRDGGPQLIISKPSDTVLLCYSALNAFFCRLFR